MSEDLDNEIQAIRSIYGDEALQAADDAKTYILSIPYRDASLRIWFPFDYPESIPQLLGTEKTGNCARKGYGNHVLDLARGVLRKAYNPGAVCLFDLLQELDVSLANEPTDHQLIPLDNHRGDGSNETNPHSPPPSSPALQEEPVWTLSTPVTDKKSTFLARACPVVDPTHAKACIAHLLATDKRAAKATHNITAYRSRSPANAGSASQIIYQDCDDDGETAAGGRLLHLLQVMDVWGILVVVSRWYGGVKQGPDRFSIINNVAREAVVEGGWTRSRVMKD